MKFDQKSQFILCLFFVGYFVPSNPLCFRVCPVEDGCKVVLNRVPGMTKFWRGSYIISRGPTLAEFLEKADSAPRGEDFAIFFLVLK